MNLAEHNTFFRLNRLLCFVFSLLAVSVVNASPTVVHRDINLSTISTLTNMRPTTTDSINTIVKNSNAELANIRKEFLQPPECFAGLLNANSNSVRLLPAVPATVMMLLIGFLCVSLYRDRKVWLAALAALLWAGQVGVQTLPQLALRLSLGNHNKQQLDAERAFPFNLENSHRLRSDIEGTQYIGLLHHLNGIPGKKSAINSHISQPTAIIWQHGFLQPQFHCPALKAVRTIYISTVSVFETIPRGPPLPA